MSGLLPRLLPIVEHAVKKPVWGCRMCGQCVLHSTGMTCPMTCPKTLRNGPCGGVRENGHCEVVPEMRCVWVKAEERSRHPLMPSRWESEMEHVMPPVNNRLGGSSSWVNLVTGKDRATPSGWGREDPQASLPPSEGSGSLEPGWCSLVELDDPLPSDAFP